MRQHLTHSHAHRHIGCFCNAGEDLRREKATCKLILQQIFSHLICAFKLLRLWSEFFWYGSNTQHRLYWIWSLQAACMCAVYVCKTSWPHLKDSERGPDWWLSGDRFLFPALHASLSGEITVVSVCQLELSLSSLLQASYSYTLLPGWRQRGERKDQEQERKTEGFFYTRHSALVAHQHPLMQLENLKRRKERIKAVSHPKGASCTMNRPPPTPPHPTHGLVWYSPLGLAERPTGLHGGQANIEQIQAGDIEMHYMHLNQAGTGPVDW